MMAAPRNYTRAWAVPDLPGLECFRADQIMHHFEGDMWIAWNNKMKGILLKAQSRAGHEAGSFYDDVGGDHGSHAAGRLYCTALSTMILEVYYRHLQIYKNQSVDEEFKE